ncbi:glycine cleavage system protein R [Plasticicumulans sp.]|uniref:glycine cleavage system protein R n=1 Tax=Plasticicumulans sp. TaxID=2307179 RepID=UPI000FAD5BA2|nr:ACT domain-containing protein [Plasticicumulans sp.]MBS0600032.1 ACT domain-containing protein [Pseudomonadota bacterium]RTL02661.1 MAG: ACT domain-containing protein [Xanthomonadales bacterium]HMV39212.1 ACT domain-containing protein [Plasticicumulans sp.]HMW28818.1 ACT domain-containing protein [Plasticicumulans sp.]HMW41768.1 ACT domain-containing protein [Plasticicumulans sp.]
MHTSLVLTVIGPDRPGLVEAIAAVIARHGANWEESRMAQLGGQFAGMLRVTAPEETQDALEDALAGLGSVGLKVTVARAAGAQAQVPKLLHLNLVGQDRPGIVREIAEALARRGVSIESLETRCVSASMSGEMLFEAEAVLAVPPALAADELRTALEALANELMVDLDLAEPAGA